MIIQSKDFLLIIPIIHCHYDSQFHECLNFWDQFTVQPKDWANVKKAQKFLKHQTSKKPFLLYLGINTPHPYKTNSSGAAAGGSTFRSSPYYLNKIKHPENIPFPEWKPLDEEHPVGLILKT
jgi:hypothetical protein